MSREHLVEEVAEAVMVATGCGVVRDDKRIFCDHCDCSKAARVAISIVLTRIEEIAQEMAADCRMARSNASAFNDRPAVARFENEALAIESLASQILALKPKET